MWHSSGPNIITVEEICHKTFAYSYSGITGQSNAPQIYFVDISVYHWQQHCLKNSMALNLFHVKITVYMKFIYKKDNKEVDPGISNELF